MNAVFELPDDDRQFADKVRLPRVLFLVRSLGQGGAERQLVTLATGLHRRGWPVSVACFYGDGVFQAELERAGVPLINLRKHGRWDVIRFLWRLLRAYRESHATLVHGYMPIANLLALLARVARPGTRVVWGVRSTISNRANLDWLSRLSLDVTCKAARFADVIIANSEAGATHHVALGYPGERIKVVANGIDTQRFRFNPDGRQRVRREWDIPDDAVLVGMVGRIDSLKGHVTFLQAAARLADHDTRWRFVCVGNGESAYVRAVKQQVEPLGLADRVIWAGSRNDMTEVYSAMDIAVSSSWGEGFPNVIAEAMACERPCVVTDVGDSARIVGACGAVVPARDPAALADAVLRTRTALDDEQQHAGMGATARNRIVETFSIDALLRNSEQVLRELCGYYKPT